MPPSHNLLLLHCKIPSPWYRPLQDHRHAIYKPGCPFPRVISFGRSHIMKAVVLVQDQSIHVPTPAPSTTGTWQLSLSALHAPNTVWTLTRSQTCEIQTWLSISNGDIIWPFTYCDCCRAGTRCINPCAYACTIYSQYLAIFSCCSVRLTWGWGRPPICCEMIHYVGDTIKGNESHVSNIQFHNATF